MSSSQIKRISFNQVNVPNLGSLKGVSDNRSHTIRYFDIPIGSIPRRWEKAIPVEPWEGVLDVATPKVFTSDEDEERNSLCGSVFVPNIRSFKNNNLFPGATHRFPVLVVVSNSVSDCSDIVETSIEQERPIIAVKLYHRTGHLGFLASKELALETWSHAQDIIKDEMNWDEGSFGNWGLLDLILGLQWIQTHIHAFGGDCNRVTVMGGPKDEVGESAQPTLARILEL
ncbi:hypothetical protein BGZ76_003070 [Entomortierella beljakovae]|nr:hypothetical protein BGZ76_003070 [Entomortierella beljakovae]